MYSVLTIVRVARGIKTFNTTSGSNFTTAICSMRQRTRSAAKLQNAHQARSKSKATHLPTKYTYQIHIWQTGLTAQPCAPMHAVSHSGGRRVTAGLISTHDLHRWNEVSEQGGE